jgi:hypothetical protein
VPHESNPRHRVSCNKVDQIWRMFASWGQLHMLKLQKQSRVLSYFCVIVSFVK